MAFNNGKSYNKKEMNALFSCSHTTHNYILAKNCSFIQNFVSGWVRGRLVFRRTSIPNASHRHNKLLLAYVFSKLKASDICEI